MEPQFQVVCFECSSSWPAKWCAPMLCATSATKHCGREAATLFFLHARMISNARRRNLRTVQSIGHPDHDDAFLNVFSFTIRYDIAHVTSSHYFQSAGVKEFLRSGSCTKRNHLFQNLNFDGHRECLKMRAFLNVFWSDIVTPCHLLNESNDGADTFKIDLSFRGGNALCPSTSIFWISLILTIDYLNLNISYT